MAIRNSHISKPQGYSLEKVEELLKEADENSKEELDGKRRPESYSDLRVLGNLEISEDNMSFFTV